jgi:hypothetical protein
MMAPMFAPTAVVRAVTCADAEALPVHPRLTVGGVHVALALAWLWQLPWQVALALHDGGVTWPVQTGFVYATEHPPWQLPEQLTLAPPESVQPPVHPPLHVPAQWTDADAGIAVQFPVQVPWHVPLQVAPFTCVVPALPTHEPVQFPPHVPAHWIVGAVALTSHSPLHSAEQEPWQLTTGALTDP